MQAANVVVVLTAFIVYPAVGFIAIRSFIDTRSRPTSRTSERRTIPLGPSAILTVAVAALYCAGFYATSPFDDVSRFSSVYLATMLPIEIGLRKRSVSGYVTATIFALVLVCCLVATIFVRLRIGGP